MQFPWNSTEMYCLNAILLLFFNTPKPVHNFILIHIRTKKGRYGRDIAHRYVYIAKCSTQNSYYYYYYLQNVLPTHGMYFLWSMHCVAPKNWDRCPHGYCIVQPNQRYFRLFWLIAVQIKWYKPPHANEVTFNLSSNTIDHFIDCFNGIVFSLAFQLLIEPFTISLFMRCWDSPFLHMYAVFTVSCVLIHISFKIRWKLILKLLNVLEFNFFFFMLIEIFSEKLFICGIFG